MNKSTWESTVKPVVVLSVIALVVSFLLALVNSFTAPIIEENQKAATLAAYVDVMPTVSDAKTLEEVTDYTTENVTGVVKAEDGSIAIKAEEKGFDGGILTVIMGYDTNGTVTGISDNSEKKRLSVIKTPTMGFSGCSARMRINSLATSMSFKPKNGR